MSDSRLKGTAVAMWILMKDSFHPEHKPEPTAFSNGWLQKFKGQRAFKRYIGHSKSGSVNLDLYRTQIKQVQMALEDFGPDNIYNCHETGLFLKALSNKPLATGPIRGRKITRVARESVLVCSNAA
ncbi:hypothetical protein BGZ54_001794, partial [Gamsiella multidivaricata]